MSADAQGAARSLLRLLNLSLSDRRQDDANRRGLFWFI